MSTEDLEDDDKTTDFAQLLKTHQEGEVNAEASKKLAEVIAEGARIVSTEKATGSVTVEFKVSVLPNGSTVVAATVNAKTPKRKAAGSTYWLGKDNKSLVRDNPRQMKLDNVRTLKKKEESK